MQLSQLFKNFGTSTPEEQAEFIALYRLRRAEDMEKPSTYKKKLSASPKKTVEKLTLSDEEKALMKLLGLKQKDILAMRAVTTEIEDEIQDDSDLLKDTTFDGGEEE
jgi:hypothetical protein